MGNLIRLTLGITALALAVVGGAMIAHGLGW